MSTAQAVQSSSRSVLNGAIRGTVLYAIPLIGQRLLSIIVLSIVTRVLTRDDFGMLSLLEQVSAVLSILFCGNFSSSLGYFYNRANSEGERSRVAGTGIGGALLLGTIAALACWPAQGALARTVFRSQEAMRYLPLVWLCMPMTFALEALLVWLRVEDRQAMFTKASLLRIALSSGGVALLVGVLRMHVMGYLWSTLTSYTFTTALVAVYLFRYLRPRLSLPLFARMVRFTAPLGLSMIALFVVNFGDQFVLRQYRSFTEVGIYALAYRIGMIVSNAFGALYGYWSAQAYRIMDMENADDVFARLFTYALLLLTWVTLLLTVCSEPGLHVLVAKDFRAAAPLIPIIAGANAVRSVGEFLRCRFLTAGRPSYEAWCDWAGMIICLSFYFLWIPRYGMWGAAVATFATFVAMAVISMVWTYRLRPYKVESARLVKMGGVAALIFALYFAIPVSSLVPQILWAALLLALFPIGLWLLRFPTPGEWEALSAGMRRVINWRYGPAVQA